MSQVSVSLRKTESGYAHWCPGCSQMHSLPDTWKFDGNIDSPSFTPSFKHEGYQIVCGADGRWTGEWKRDASGNPIPYVCHYILTAGRLNFCGDCTHDLKNRNIPLPPLPSGYID